MSDEYVPAPEQINAFKAAWHDADDDGQAGKRVEIALAKVMGPALQVARSEAWDEGWEAGMDYCHGDDDSFINCNPYREAGA